MTLKEFGIKLEELNKAYDEIVKAEKKKKKLRKPEIGETIEVAGITWKVLDKLESGYLVISDGLYEENTAFDSNCNNWVSSDLRNNLNTDLKKKIKEDLGEDSLIVFERDLLSLDGQTEYGTCEDTVSMLTVNEYRKYRKLLPNTGKWWWTITPDSTACNEDSTWVAVVSPSGYVNYYYCRSRGCVRPLCIFSSSIFESDEE